MRAAFGRIGENISVRYGVESSLLVSVFVFPIASGRARQSVLNRLRHQTFVNQMQPGCESSTLASDAAAEPRPFRGACDEEPFPQVGNPEREGASGAPA